MALNGVEQGHGFIELSLGRWHNAQTIIVILFDFLPLSHPFPFPGKPAKQVVMICYASTAGPARSSAQISYYVPYV